MTPKESIPFLVNAIKNSENLRILSANSTSSSLRIATALENDNSGHHFELSIRNSGEESELGHIFDLHFTTSDLHETRHLAKMTQSVLGAIAVQGVRTFGYWTGRVFPKAFTVTEMQRVKAYLKEHPMSTVEDISDALAMPQITVAYSLSNSGNKIGSSPPGVEPRQFFLK